MDPLGAIAGAGGVFLVTGLLVEACRRMKLVTDGKPTIPNGDPTRDWTPALSIGIAIVVAELYGYIGWLGFPAGAVVATPVAEIIGYGFIGIISGAAVDGITAQAKPTP